MSSHLEKIGLAESVWCNNFGTLEFVEGLKLPEEGVDVKLQLILVNLPHSTVAATQYPPPRPLAGSYAHIPGEGCMQLVGARVGSTGPVLQILEICTMMTDYCFWAQRYKEVGGHCCCISLHCFKFLPLLLKLLTRDLSANVFLSNHFFFFLPFW